MASSAPKSSLLTLKDNQDPSPNAEFQIDSRTQNIKAFSNELHNMKVEIKKLTFDVEKHKHAEEPIIKSAF